jgi:hypothetical protein
MRICRIRRRIDADEVTRQARADGGAAVVSHHGEAARLERAAAAHRIARVSVSVKITYG